MAALTPDDASSLHVISTIEELLGIHHVQLERAQVRQSYLTPLAYPNLAMLGSPDYLLYLLYLLWISGPS